MRAVGGGLLMAALLLAAGCGGSEGPPRVALPEGFPVDVPAPLGARLRTAIVQQDQATAVWETNLPVAATGGAYRERLAGEGWELIAEVSAAEGTFLSYRKGERTVAVSLGPAPQGTTVGVACELRRGRPGG